MMARKIEALAAEADEHGDRKTAELCAAALAGDRAAVTKLQGALRAVKLAAAKDSRTPHEKKSPWAAPPAKDVHPWSHDQD